MTRFNKRNRWLHDKGVSRSVFNLYIQRNACIKRCRHFQGLPKDRIHSSTSILLTDRALFGCFFFLPADRNSFGCFFFVDNLSTLFLLLFSIYVKETYISETKKLHTISNRFCQVQKSPSGLMFSVLENTQKNS